MIDDEEMLDIADINADGNLYFDMVDEENKRHMDRVRELKRQMEEIEQLRHKEVFYHHQNMATICASFGLPYQRKGTIRRKLSKKRKKFIRRKVRIWSQSNPQSAFYLKIK